MSIAMPIPPSQHDWAVANQCAPGHCYRRDMLQHDRQVFVKSSPQMSIVKLVLTQAVFQWKMVAVPAVVEGRQQSLELVVSELYAWPARGTWGRPSSSQQNSGPRNNGHSTVKGTTVTRQSRNMLRKSMKIKGFYMFFYVWNYQIHNLTKHIKTSSSHFTSTVNLNRLKT